MIIKNLGIITRIDVSYGSLFDLSVVMKGKPEKVGFIERDSPTRVYTLPVYDV